MELMIAYLSLSVVVALCGRKCRVGFWGVLLFAVVATPVVVFYALLGLRPAEAKPQTAKLRAKRWWKFKEVS